MEVFTAALTRTMTSGTTQHVGRGEQSLYELWIYFSQTRDDCGKTKCGHI